MDIRTELNYPIILPFMKIEFVWTVSYFVYLIELLVAFRYLHIYIYLVIDQLL